MFFFILQRIWDNLLLQVIARGVILVDEEHLVLNSSSQQTTYMFPVTSQMTPNFFVLASYITDDYEVVADYMSMSADLQLKTQVCLQNMRSFAIMLFSFSVPQFSAHLKRKKI